MNHHVTPLTGLRRRETVSSVPKGLDLVRAGIALAEKYRNWAMAERYAEKRWGDSSSAARVTKDLGALTMKADLPAHGTSVPPGSAIVGSDGIAAGVEFFETVVAASVLGRVPFRRVPFYVPFVTVDERSNCAWEQEGQAIVNSPLKITRHAALTTFKVAAMTVATMEMLEVPNVNAEMMIRDSLVRSLAHKLDTDLLDPANSGTANEKPASITNGAGAADSPSESLFEFDSFTGDMNNAWALLNPMRAGRMHSANRYDTGVRGGMFHGMPLVTSSAVPEESLIILDPTYVVVALGSAQVDVSSNATVEMEDAPNQASFSSVQANNQVSMFQTNSAAIRAIVQANWKVVRADAVQIFDLTGFGL